MKTNELIKKLNTIKTINAKVEDGLLKLTSGEMTVPWLQVNLDATNLKVYQDYYFDYASTTPFNELRKAINLLNDWLLTSPELRDPTPKYRVRLRGFNSDNGHQYLTTADSYHNKIFACALHSNLKQEFTADELAEIINRPQFKGIPWIHELFRAGIEEIKDEEG